MYFFYILLLIISNVLGDLYIEDFTKNEVSNWKEHSDTMKIVGKSKAILTTFKTDSYQRAILFTLLNPQSCGAGFAGVRKHVSLDLSNYHAIKMKVRGQGQYKRYKFIVKEKGSDYVFCHLFEAPENSEIIILPLDEFKPYHEGKLVENPGLKLEKNKIELVGFVAFAGKYSTVKQKGAASLEIDWIQVLK